MNLGGEVMKIKEVENLKTMKPYPYGLKIRLSIAEAKKLRRIALNQGVSLNRAVNAIIAEYKEG